MKPAAGTAKASNPVSPLHSLTSGKLLFRNTFWNLLGQILPLIVALVSIPFLIKALGTDRFGILSLAWVIIGYFGLFDIGLGRALTKMVAEQLGAGIEDEIPPTVWTALLLMSLLGILGALVLLISSSWLTYELLKIPAGLQEETRQSLMLLAVSIPIVIITTGLRGVLEAKQYFGLANALRIPLSISMYAGPLLVIPLSSHLQPIILVLLVIRLLGLFAHFKLCLYALPELSRRMSTKRELIRPLISLGGWMTVSNILGPIMVYADRFLISAFISVAAVAYYTTPYEIVTKLWILPSALISVLFPAMSASFSKDRDRTTLLYEKSLRYVFIILFPLTLMVMVFSHEGLLLWLGPEFAKNSRVVQWLAAGVYINSFAQVAFALIQGSGRPDITAKLHFIEIPFYLAALYLLMKRYGLEGAAIAWVLRIAVDTSLLFYAARLRLSGAKSGLIPFFAVFSSSLLVLYFACSMAGIIVKAVMTMSVMALFISTTWFVLLGRDEKSMLIGYAARLIRVLEIRRGT